MFVYSGFAMLVLFLALMIGRGVVMKLNGVKLLVIGQKSSRELISFLFCYALVIYIIASNCFPLPMFHIVNRFFWNLEWLRRVGVLISAIANVSFFACIVSFGNSFRVGIDEERAGKFVNTGMFAVSRNPMTTSMDALFFGIFLVYPNLGTLAVLVVVAMVYHSQIKKEEAFCRSRYGEEYDKYCKRVRRYL
jgi:protein-S-isoprenylcysteine O-methyltransferase Ste14